MVVRASNSPPKLGGVPASLSEQAAWFQRQCFKTTALEPPRLATLGTPPNLGGELLALPLPPLLNLSQQLLILHFILIEDSRTVRRFHSLTHSSALEVSGAQAVPDLGVQWIHFSSALQK